MQVTRGCAVMVRVFPAATCSLTPQGTMMGRATVMELLIRYTLLVAPLRSGKYTCADAAAVLAMAGLSSTAPVPLAPRRVTLYCWGQPVLVARWYGYRGDRRPEGTPGSPRRAAG